MGSHTTGLLWLRRDLRLADNPALHAALACCDTVIPVYIHAPEEAEQGAAGGASRWWLHHSLAALGEELAALGSRLLIRRGQSARILGELIEQTGASHLFWNRLY
ncbi:MAG: deoxyribodipyrimidine photo-lyase, partial [Pseudomonadota bacterium]